MVLIFKEINFILITVAFILISITFYILPIISRFSFRKKDVMKISNSIVLFFFWSALCYLVMFNEKSIIMDLEGKCASFEDGYISIDKTEK